jgi:hypothetical protein
MGLFSRLRGRLQGSRGGVGVGFTPALEKEWEDIPEQVDAFTKKVGSSIVGSWEVGAAELGRAVVGLEQDQVWIDRFSDALVPTLTPYQDLHKKATSACKTALVDAQRSRRVQALVPPLVGLVVGLGPEAELGWGKTVGYLGPVLELTKRADLAASMLKTGPKLLESARASEQILKEELEKLAEAETLFEGVCDAFEAWQLYLCRELELELDRPVQELVKALKAAR